MYIKKVRNRRYEGNEAHGTGKEVKHS